MTMTPTNQTPTNQTPSECKYLKYDMCLHSRHSDNPWRCPIMDLEDKHCSSYEPKEKKGNNTIDYESKRIS